MTSVMELIKILESYPPDAIVVCEWDSGWANVDTHESQTDDKENTVVVFDCNEYGTYRRDRDY